jgi:trehalose 6-phosphate phosphatase
MESAAARIVHRGMSWERKSAGARRGARSALRAWPEIAARLRSAERVAILLDFDGTLVKLQSRPEKVRTPERVKQLLERLAMNPRITVAIVSGRKLGQLRRMIGVTGIRYFGLHGADGDFGRTPLGKATRGVVERAKRIARSRVKSLAGVWVEDKGPGFAVHYRGAHPATAENARAALCDLLAPWRDTLYVLNGKKVWEVLPRGIAGKGAAVSDLFRRQKGKVAAVYVGDDSTDERAFQALAGQITVRVGERQGTKASFYLQRPADVLRFLARIEREPH